MSSLFNAAVKPKSLHNDLLLTFDTAISHHDPAVQDKSNKLLFNRQKQLLYAPAQDYFVRQESINRFCAAFQFPIEMVDIIEDLDFASFTAVCAIGLFIRLYGRGDGSGLLTGVERYERLETRMRNAAIRSTGMRRFWALLCDDLHVNPHKVEEDALLMELFKLPRPLQAAALVTIVREYRAIMSIARLWQSEVKRGDAEYAKNRGENQNSGETTIAMFTEDSVKEIASAVVPVDVPAVSNNALRHQVVRDPLWLHLAGALGLKCADPGFADVPAGVEGIFVNGGNIASGAKQPTNPFALAQKIRQHYPSLDLLGGVTDSFDVGESRLSVSGWIVCKENARALEDTPAADLPGINVSVYDMLDDVTATRQATDRGEGQMIYNFETLCSGVDIYTKLSLAPFTTTLTQGALVAAVDTFLANSPVVGGQSARGFGHLRGKVVNTSLEGDAAELKTVYEDYLLKNAEILLDGMKTGQLGSGSKVLS